MPEIRLAHPTDLEGWRTAARRLLALRVPPELVAWRVLAEDAPQPGLFEEQPLPEGGADGALTVPLRFLLLAREVAAHGDPGRFALLYRLLWRVSSGGERDLLRLLTDPDVARALAMARAVRRAAHRMKELLRFKEVWTAQGPRHVGWFEPEHYVLELCASFLTQRFSAMRWLVVTPYRSASWDGATLLYGPGGRRSEVPAEGAKDEDWRAYCASIVNPARLNPRRIMRDPMPRHHWRNLPAARAVPGEGPADARVMLVGEQPGDREELEGRPFVGPAGRLLDRALADAGLDRKRLYLTNAVKHLKLTSTGRRRLHRRPEAGEIAACGRWLDLERELARPRLTVALGVTAARALLGREVRIEEERGRIVPLGAGGGGDLLVTAHPAHILRLLPDPGRQAQAYARLVRDLRLAAPYLAAQGEEAAGVAA